MSSFGPILIRLNAGFFVVYGLLFVFVPEPLATTITGGAPSTASGMIDLRATYGGMSIAVGWMLAAFARDEALHATGLRAVAATLLCMAGGRTVGIVVDGNPNTWMWIYLAAEIAVAAAALVALRAGSGPRA
ncbi:MAG: DUF4345 domain-containing protein [Myxococcota bacterium]